MALTRRKFIQLGSVAAGGLGLGSGLVTNAWGLDPDRVHDPATDGDRVVPTFCELCFWKCGVLAHVKGDRVTKIVGNPAHPLSNGKLCPRGTGGTGLLYDPDRLKRPLLRRKGVHRAQVFEEVSWGTALDFIAEKLKRIKAQHGPEAVALFSHGSGGSFFKTLLSAYGSGNVTAPSYAQCRGSRDVAFQLTYGAPVGSPEQLDLENSRVLTLVGSHLGENMHNTQVQELARALDRGAQLVVIDPRFSTVAGKAKYWLPVKPGTDVALLLAFMNVILGEGLHDAAYLAEHAIGLEQLRAHVADKTPEWAFAQTSIAPERIVEVARFLAGGRPASLVHPGRHTAWYGDDTQRGRAIAILNALLGSWGRKGGFYLPTTLPVGGLKLPSFGPAPRPAPDTPLGVRYPFADEVLAHGLRDASIPGTASYDIKGWLVYGSNLIQALPEPAKTVEAIQHLELLVAVDVLPAEITGYADVVLPESTYLERWDDVSPTPYKEPFLAIRQEVVPPMYDSKPGWWIAKELARRLELGAYFPWENAEELVSRRLAAAGHDFAAIKQTGVIRGTPTPVTMDEGLTPVFATPSGKIELFSQQLADAGLDPLPGYTPPEEPPEGSFRLLFGRAPTHTFGRTTNNRMLSEIYSENELWLNAQLARERGLSTGDQVVMVNQDGVRSEKIRVKATQRIRPDCVYLVHGYGHTNPGLTFAVGRGVDDTRLVTRTRIDPVMGGTGMSVNFVQLERA